MLDKIQVTSFYRYLISKGYFFDKKLIENFLLSLKIKPFIILTGNSGTGKTKLPQLFAEYLSASTFHIVNATTKLRSWGKGKDGVSNKRPGWTLSPEDFRNVLPLTEIEGTYDIEIDGYKSTAEIYFFPQLYYTRDCEEFRLYFKKLYDIEQEQIKKDEENQEKHVDQKVKLGIIYDAIESSISDEYKQSSEIVGEIDISGTLLKGDRIGVTTIIQDYIPLKNKSSCIITAGGFFAKGNFELKFRMGKYLTKEIEEHLKCLKEKDVKSVEIKIIGLTPNISDYVPTTDSFEYHHINCDNLDNNYSIVPVGANWTDNTSIVGFNNVITGKYQSTPTCELIKRAQNNLKNPYFLILDEMNLSHVERYFADFLSSIESGEGIPLYGTKKTLNLPKNLFIIGTVNVDETTYMFSPKVLDRANTIEFNTLSALDYMVSDNDNDDNFIGDINYLQSPLLNLDISNKNIGGLKEIFNQISCNGNSLWDTLAVEIAEFQNALKDSSFDFGFRVINEILRFMVVAWRYENSPEEWKTWERYFDAQIKQKMLPKLHGSEKAIGNVLTKLFNLCLINRSKNENPKNFKVTEENCRYYTSALKIQKMFKILADQRYVSFIN